MLLTAYSTVIRQLRLLTAYSTVVRQLHEITDCTLECSKTDDVGRPMCDKSLTTIDAQYILILFLLIKSWVTHKYILILLIPTY